MATHCEQKRFPLAQLLVLAVCVGLGNMALAQEHARPKGVGIPQDWSTRHVLYTAGASPRVARAAMSDTRFWYSWLQRYGNTYAWHPYPGFAGVAPTHYPGRGPVPSIGHHPRIDWAVSLGGVGGMPVGETPAKYSFSINGTITSANCTSDFVVFVVNATPKTTGTQQANIVALNNLYTGTTSSFCPNGAQTPPTTDYTSPKFMWAYAAGSAGIALSPVLSEDGTKVAYIDMANPANFNVLTWVSGQGTSATAPAKPGSGGSALVQLAYSKATVSGCTASSASTSNASPYIDYNTDSAYVASDNGNLYRITGVFKGTPTLQYCIKVNNTAGHYLTSPVYDQVNNVVYVSDGYSLYGFTPGASSFTAAGSIAIASTAATDPIVLSPYLDTSDGFIYVFSRADSTNTHSIVAQVNLALTSQATAVIGETTTQYILDGDFDNAYFTTGPLAGAGTLYACGTDSTDGTKPSLYALSFANGTGLMNSTPAMSDNRNINGAANAAGACSPLVDFYDGTTDRLFVGTGNLGATTGANLVTEWNVNSRISSSSTQPTSTATGYWGGTTAFTIDNVSTEPQAASIYFGTMSPPPTGTTTPCGSGNYCAVKLTQSALQ